MQLLTRLRARAAALCAAALIAAAAAIAAPAPAFAVGGSATDWMNQGKFGVGMHYLAEGCPPGCSTGSYVTGQWPSAADWNNRVNSFDVPGLVQQLQSVGAKWFQISVGQISGYWASPNSVYEGLVPPTPEHPSRLAQRDLIRDIGLALQGTGIKLMVYVPAVAPRYDSYATVGLGGDPKGTDGEGGTYKPEFQANWLNVVSHWSQQWGNLVSGWWIDGGWLGHTTYFDNMISAARTGNAQSVVALNPGLNKWGPNSPNADFTAGEIDSDEWPQTTARFDTTLGTKAQKTYFAVAQTFWGNPPDAPMATSGDLMAWRTLGVTNAGGAITWDVGYDRANGRISAPAMASLRAVGEAVGNIPAAGNRSEETASTITYDGSWGTASGSQYSGGAARVSSSPGGSATFRFTGPSVKWIGARSEASGKADVSVDGQFVATVDLSSSPATGNDVVFSRQGLAEGSHTITVTPQSAAAVTIDGFEVGTSDVDDSNPLVTYTGSFGSYNPGGCFDNTCHNANTVGSTATYRFNGSRITWHGITGPDQGVATVSIDGGPPTTVNLVAPTRSVNVPVYTSPELPLDSRRGEHTIKITTQNAGWVTVDRFVTTPLLGSLVDDAQSGITYTGSFSSSNPGGCYAGTCHNANSAGSTATASFTGKGVTWYGIKGSDQGQADVYIDGVLDTTVNLTAPSRTVLTPVYTKTGLPPGDHTFKIVTKSGAWVTLDALQIT